MKQSSWPRRKARIGFVHLGYGAFHRAHQSVYVDDYMEITGDLEWGIAAVNLRPSESDSFRRSQSARDGYVLKTSAPDGSRQLRMVRPHLQFADWSLNNAEAEALVALPSVHAITMTVTESGYYLDEDWSLDTADPFIAAEIEGKAGRTVYAFLAASLELRRRSGGGPVTLLCCDNIRSNGKVLRRNFLHYLELRGLHELAAWLQDNATFPCSMVDRITPRTTPELEAEAELLAPGRYLAPVQAEDFVQWVLEDSFAGPFPDLSRSGVQIVNDVNPYEEAKIRILNGGHLGLVYLALLAGHSTFDRAIADPELRTHFFRWEHENVLPGLTLDLPFDKAGYLDEVVARFSNRAIADQLERIGMDGWSKVSTFIRPTLEGCLSRGISPRHGYASVASWYVYARRFAEGRTSIPYHDPYWPSLKPLLAPGNEEEFARTRALWADLPVAHQEFVPGIVRAISEMEEKWPA